MFALSKQLIEKRFGHRNIGQEVSASHPDLMLKDYLRYLQVQITHSQFGPHGQFWHFMVFSLGRFWMSMLVNARPCDFLHLICSATKFSRAKVSDPFRTMACRFRMDIQTKKSQVVLHHRLLPLWL